MPTKAACPHVLAYPFSPLLLSLGRASLPRRVFDHAPLPVQNLSLGLVHVHMEVVLQPVGRSIEAELQLLNRDALRLLDEHAHDGVDEVGLIFVLADVHVGPLAHVDVVDHLHHRGCLVRPLGVLHVRQQPVRVEGAQTHVGAPTQGAVDVRAVGSSAEQVYRAVYPPAIPCTLQVPVLSHGYADEQVDGSELCPLPLHEVVVPAEHVARVGLEDQPVRLVVPLRHGLPRVRVVEDALPLLWTHLPQQHAQVPLAHECLADEAQRLHGQRASAHQLHGAVKVRHDARADELQARRKEVFQARLVLPQQHVEYEEYVFSVGAVEDQLPVQHRAQPQRLPQHIAAPELEDCLGSVHEDGHWTAGSRVWDHVEQEAHSVRLLGDEVVSALHLQQILASQVHRHSAHEIKAGVFACPGSLYVFEVCLLLTLQLAGERADLVVHVAVHHQQQRGLPLVLRLRGNAVVQQVDELLRQSSGQCQYLVVVALHQPTHRLPLEQLELQFHLLLHPAVPHPLQHLHLRVVQSPQRLLLDQHVAGPLLAALHDPGIEVHWVLGGDAVRPRHGCGLLRGHVDSDVVVVRQEPHIDLRQGLLGFNADLPLGPLDPAVSVVVQAHDLQRLRRRFEDGGHELGLQLPGEDGLYTRFERTKRVLAGVCDCYALRSSAALPPAVALHDHAYARLHFDGS
mmetsp:Transcript_10813/g.23950  ORF Transcript_10813/g.23950 Transcript_10813/m.23950 type:complete len:682 (-) Transcript_10813:407-2452(-)